MQENKKPNDFQSIKLSKDFCSIIDWIIEHGDLGFETRTEVIRFAVRELYLRAKDRKDQKGVL